VRASEGSKRAVAGHSKAARPDNAREKGSKKKQAR